MSYYRTLPMSEDIVSEKIKVKLTDDMLDITLPKSTKTQKKKPVSIQ